jgi:hypothetical protein
MRRQWAEGGNNGWPRHARFLPPHVDGSNDGGSSFSRAPCSPPSSLLAAVAWGRRHGDNRKNGDNNSNDGNNGNNGVHSNGGEHDNGASSDGNGNSGGSNGDGGGNGDSGGGNGDNNGAPPQPLPPLLQMQSLVLACFVILCLLLF